MSISGWTVAAGDVDLVNTNYYASAGGNQSLDLNGFGSGEIFQDLITASNQTYRLSFALGANPVPRPGAGPDLKKVEVRWDSTVLATLEHDITGHTSDDVGWRQFSFLVQGAGMNRLSFRSLTTGNAGGAIDQVSLVPQDAQPPFVESLNIRRAVQVAFPTVSGKTYQPQWAPKADTSIWTYLGPPILGDGDPKTFYDLSENPMRIYRVLVGSPN